MAKAEDVTFERITRVYRDESSKKTLTQLEPDFWERVERYVAKLEADLAAERAKNPNSKAGMLLQDELRKVEQKREQIYQYRERKIGLLASARVGGESVETRGLARPEPELLEGLVSLLAEARAAAMGGASFAAKVPVATAEASEPVAPKAPKVAAEPRGILVHVLEDVPPFAGPDQTYRLHKEDLVTLPPQLAKVLVDRGKARVVTPSP